MAHATDEQDGTREWYDADQVADAWGVSAAAARRWARSGRVPARRTPGGEWQFGRGALPPPTGGAQ